MAILGDVTSYCMWWIGIERKIIRISPVLCLDTLIWMFALMEGSCSV